MIGGVLGGGVHTNNGQVRMAAQQGMRKNAANGSMVGTCHVHNQVIIEVDRSAILKLIVEVAHIVLGVVIKTPTEHVQPVPHVVQENTRQVGVLVEVVQQMLIVLVVRRDILMKQV